MTLPLMEPVVLAPPPCANASVDASSNAGSTATSKWNLRRFMNSSLSLAFRRSEPSTRVVTLTAHLEQHSLSVQPTIQVLVRWSVETAGFGMFEQTGQSGQSGQCGQSGQYARQIKEGGRAMIRPVPRSVASSFHLRKGFVDQTFVVFLGQVSLNQLRRDHDRQIDGFTADLLQRAARLELDLAFGVLDDRLGFGAGLLLHFLAQPLGVASASADDGVGLDARLADDFGRFGVQPLELLLGFLGIVERPADRLLAAFEGTQKRTPGEPRQQRQQHKECDDGPDEQPRVRLNERVIHKKTCISDFRVQISD